MNSKLVRRVAEDDEDGVCCVRMCSMETLASKQRACVRAYVRAWHHHALQYVCGLEERRHHLWQRHVSRVKPPHRIGRAVRKTTP